MFPLIDIHGSPRERGRQYGGHARERIARSIDFYAGLFAYCGMDWREVQSRATRYRQPIADASPALLDEIIGIAEGAGFAETAILALNARTEILPPTYPDKPSPGIESIRARNRAGGVGETYDWGECTALAVLPSASRDGKTWLAQNWDWIGNQRDALVLLRVTDDDGRQLLTLTEAGMLAKIGLNDRGLGVCLNILRSLDDGQAPGMPVHVLLRHLLGCGDVRQACAAARSLTHGASSNVLIADSAGNAASIELSPRGVAIIEPDGGTLAHTNHFLDPALAVHAAPLNALATTEQRLACAHRHAAAEKIGREDIAALLSDIDDGAFAVCRFPDPALASEVRLETVAGVIMDLTSRTMWVAPDIPSRVAFEPIRLEAESLEAIGM